MSTPDMPTVPSAESGEKNVEQLNKRFEALFDKFGIDPSQEVPFGNINFMIRASQVGTNEWFVTKLNILRDVVSEAHLGDEEYEAAEEAIKSWENYQS